MSRKRVGIRTMLCVVCQKEFEYRRIGRMYCSESCAHKGWRRGLGTIKDDPYSKLHE